MYNEKVSKLHFFSTIQIYNGNPYVLVTSEQAQTLKAGWKKPMPVLVQINKKPNPAWKINMMPIGDGSFYLYLHGDVREASQTKVGDEVEVLVKFDDTYQSGPMHPMPEWFSEALKQNQHAEKAWNELIPSRQKEVLRYFSWLKSDEAKKRNLEKVMFVLSGGEGRFMARNWKDGH